MKNLKYSSYAIHSLDAWLSKSVIRLQDRYEDYCMDTPNKTMNRGLQHFGHSDMHMLNMFWKY